jgi:ABC-type transport system involved in multi-copper enzyme maturation permease subunit
MRQGSCAAFRLLAGEAIRDAARRRIVLVVVALSLISLAVVDGCSSCGRGTLVLNDAVVETTTLGAAVGIAMVCVLCLWIAVLAGILAADQLARAVADGNALLWLARPVSRATFALAQLCAALAIAGVTGALLLGCAALLLATRQGLDPAPVLWAAGGAALNAATVASLAMTASFWLPRAAIALLVVGSVALLSGLEGVGLARVSLEGPLRLAIEAGPPLLQTPLVLLAPWMPEELLASAGPTGTGLLRAALWAAGSTALLLGVFSRLELRS